MVLTVLFVVVTMKRLRWRDGVLEVRFITDDTCMSRRREE